MRMCPDFKKISYDKLNAKQREIYNFQRVSAVLAELGYATIKLQDDWQGADFLAIPFDDKKESLKVQLKGRATIRTKYHGKQLNICFEYKETGVWYLYPHDKVYDKLAPKINGRLWSNEGIRSYPKLSKEMLELLNEYRLV